MVFFGKGRSPNDPGPQSALFGKMMCEGSNPATWVQYGPLGKFGGKWALK